MTPRERLARRQAELLAALVDDGFVPEGFDAERLAVEAAALRAKRRRVLRRLIDPAAADALGDTLDAQLDRWIRERPRREGTGFHADAAAFVADLRERKLVRRSLFRRAGPGRR